MAPGTEQMDFELEVACVIGMPGRDLSPDEARRHIAGFCVMNDWSARDIQRREMKLSMGPVKGKDFATTIGPWLVTPDELEPYRKANAYDLAMTAYKEATTGAERSAALQRAEKAHPIWPQTKPEEAEILAADEAYAKATGGTSFQERYCLSWRIGMTLGSSGE